MTIAEIADSLSDAQRRAIYPGPGNPEYARGVFQTIKALEAKGVVMNVNAFSTNGQRGARLTPLGMQVRAHLKEQEHG